MAQLSLLLQEMNHSVRITYHHNELEKGHIAFFFGYERIVTQEILDKHEHNLVIHGSALPHGREWSPLTWQILEETNRIPITLFEAEESVDSGPVYFQDWLEFEGHELIDELRKKQGGLSNLHFVL